MDDRVFFCYSQKDKDFVLKLAENLKNRGVPIWLDQWDIPSGANWNRTIEKALEESTRLLLILSPSSIDSDEVQCEWLSAIDEKKVVIPILYQPCHIPHRLKAIQYIDFTSRGPDNEEAIGQILKALEMAGSTLIKPIAQPEQTPENEIVQAHDKAIPLEIKDQTVLVSTKSVKYLIEVEILSFIIGMIVGFYYSYEAHIYNYQIFPTLIVCVFFGFVFALISRIVLLSRA